MQYRWLAILVPLAACGDNGGGATNPDAAPPVDAAGPIATLDIVDLPMAVDLTPDGAIALLQDNNTASNDVYFYDTATRALTKVTETGDLELPITGIAAG